MKKKIKPTYICLIVLLLLNVISFKVGIDFGIYQLTICDSPAKAFMAAKHLEMIENEEYEKIKIIQETRLTDQIVNYGKYLNHGVPVALVPFYYWPLTNPLGDTSSREKFIKTAIDYRKAHPIEPHFAPSSSCLDEEIKSEACKTIIEPNNIYNNILKYE